MDMENYLDVLIRATLLFYFVVESAVNTFCDLHDFLAGRFEDTALEIPYIRVFVTDIFITFFVIGCKEYLAQLVVVNSPCTQLLIGIDKQIYPARISAVE